MSYTHDQLTHCFVDESIHESVGHVVTAFVFAPKTFEDSVAATLRKAGLNPFYDEFKSSARMDTNPKMRAARDGLLSLTGTSAKVAVFFGPFDRTHLGRQTLQALQSVLVRNAIPPSQLTVYFDEDIFPSHREASRLHDLFQSLKECKFLARVDSRSCIGIQVADAVAHSFGQILKEAITGSRKMIDIGSSDS